VRATDLAGNPDATPANYAWTIDTTAPETTIDSGSPALSYSADASFAFSSNEAGSTFECSLDGGTFTTCTTPKTYNGLLEGTHTFEVRATDSLGITDPTPALYTWEIEEFNVVINVIGHGTVNVVPLQATYHYGDIIHLTAICDTNHFFIGWNGDITDSDEDVVFTVTGDMVITANFTQFEVLLPIIVQ
jgi:hypothetical protein